MYTYRSGSQGAKALAQGLGIKRIKHKNSKFKGSPLKTVINWGASKVPEEVERCRVINSPIAIATAANKLRAFQRLHAAGISIPAFTTNKELAFDGMIQEGRNVVCRHKLTGHSGEGIELIDRKVVKEWTDIPDAPLYVEYIPKDQEYRVHVVKGEVIFVQRKARKKDVPDDQVNWQIRNHQNGFIFAHKEGVVLPKEVLDECIEAVEALGLDFGAVDILTEKGRDLHYILEVNTAPGLTGTTLDKYVEAFRKF